MKTKDITLLSVRGRGINGELRVVRDRLKELIPDIKIHEYIRSEISSMDDLVKRLRLARKKNTKYMHGVICMDSSIPLQFANNEEGDYRLFVPALYDYLFDAMANKKTGIKTFSGCTHIIPGSPFMSRLLKEKYALDHIQILDDICTPFAWDICQKEEQEKFRKRYEFYFPGMRGKKVISIMVAGEKEDISDDNLFHSVDLKGFLDSIRGEYFVITNSAFLMQTANVLTSEYMDTLGFLNKQFDQSDVMYFTDIMITNNGRYASAVASRRIKVYVIDYLENTFIKYVKDSYPEMILSLLELKDIQKESEKQSLEQEQFCQEFSYKPDANPMKDIGMIFSSK